MPTSLLRLAVIAAVALSLAACAGAGRTATDKSAGTKPWQRQGYDLSMGTLVRVAPGDNLTRLAERHGSSVPAAVHANRLADPHRLFVGQELFLPRAAVYAEARGRGPEAPPPANPKAEAPLARPLAGAWGQAAPPPPRRPRAKPDAPRQTASPPPRETLTSASPRSDGFIWPVKGRIILSFGARANGERNDGINIAASEGTPIKAAADGVVTYAGDELRGYGNLILIRHDNGFVTAYAHASRLKVERGQKVAQGETIALAGQTGDVDRPQVHFEIRRGVQPIDPRPYLGVDVAAN